MRQGYEGLIDCLFRKTSCTTQIQSICNNNAKLSPRAFQTAVFYFLHTKDNLVVTSSNVAPQRLMHIEITEDADQSSLPFLPCLVGRE